MLPSTQNGQRHEQGFTLVELAIVLVIVGLLIGGILKGQELIASTRVTSTAAQIRAIEAATNNFYDTFGSMPGDLANPAARLPNCATALSVCLVGGANLGNGRIDFVPGAIMAAGGENTGLFAQLAAADLIAGVVPTVNVLQPGAGLLGTPIGAGTFYRVGNHGGGGAILGGVAVSGPGHYLALAAVAPGTAIDTAPLEAAAGIQPKAAQKIDAKYDDGVPGTGSVVAANTTANTAANGCATAANYNSQSVAAKCGLYIRFYQ